LRNFSQIFRRARRFFGPWRRFRERIWCRFRRDLYGLSRVPTTPPPISGSGVSEPFELVIKGISFELSRAPRLAK
jgi:hypothetical protein